MTTERTTPGMGWLDMRILKRQSVFALMTTAWCVGHVVLAQVPPLTDVEPLETYKEVVGCAENDCKVTTAIFRTLRGHASYKTDMPSVRRTSLHVGTRGDMIVVTVFPETGAKVPAFGTAGGVMAITYTFDSSGSHLVKKDYNR